MSGFTKPPEILPPDSQLGEFVLSALHRQASKLPKRIINPSLYQIPGGTHNDTVAVHSELNKFSLICRRPKEDISPNTRLYTERKAHIALPPNVAPSSYALDAENPARPIHILEHIDARALPYSQWNDETFTNLATQLGRAHSIDMSGPSVNLQTYLMRPYMLDRLNTIQTSGGTRLARHVLESTQRITETNQPLFTKPSKLVLGHNDI